MRENRIDDECRYLLREQRHRFQNQLSVLESLVKLKSGSMSSGEGKAALDEMALHIRSFSLLNRKLNKQTRMSPLMVKDFWQELTGVYSRICGHREIRMTASPGEYWDSAVSGTSSCWLCAHGAQHFGIVYNELLMNGLKHSVKGPIETQLRFQHKRAHPQLEIRVANSVSGNDPEPGHSSLTGLNLVEAMMADLGGRYSWYRDEEKNRVVATAAFLLTEQT